MGAAGQMSCPSQGTWSDRAPIAHARRLGNAWGYPQWRRAAPQGWPASGVAARSGILEDAGVGPSPRAYERQTQRRAPWGGAGSDGERIPLPIRGQPAPGAVARRVAGAALARVWWRDTAHARAPVLLHGWSGGARALLTAPNTRHAGEAEV